MNAVAEGEDRVDDVRRLTQEVIYFITPKQSRTDATKFLPPGVRFAWGSFLFNGLVDSIEESHRVLLARRQAAAREYRARAVAADHPGCRVRRQRARPRPAEGAGRVADDAGCVGQHAPGARRGGGRRRRRLAKHCRRQRHREPAPAGARSVDRSVGAARRACRSEEIHAMPVVINEFEVIDTPPAAHRPRQVPRRNRAPQPMPDRRRPAPPAGRDGRARASRAGATEHGLPTTRRSPPPAPASLSPAPTSRGSTPR